MNSLRSNAVSILCVALGACNGTNFAASILPGTTTAAAQLAVDWGVGTAAPFVTYDGSAMALDIRNSSIGRRHQIQVGPESIDILGLSSDPLIVPDPAASPPRFAIGHGATSTVENFNTYSAFITQLQAELNGTNPATGMIVAGQYIASIFTLSATSITVSLNH